MGTDVCRLMTRPWKYSINTRWNFGGGFVEGIASLDFLFCLLLKSVHFTSRDVELNRKETVFRVVVHRDLMFMWDCCLLQTEGIFLICLWLALRLPSQWNFTQMNRKMRFGGEWQEPENKMLSEVAQT